MTTLKESQPIQSSSSRPTISSAGKPDGKIGFNLTLPRKIKHSEILSDDKLSYTEKRKRVVREYAHEAKGPDRLDWDEAKAFVNLPDKAKQKKLEQDPVEWQRLVDLVDLVWDRWQNWFMKQDRDAEHPFRKGVFVRRWKPPLDVNYIMEE